MAKGNKKAMTIDKPKEYHKVEKDIYKVPPITEAESYQFKELFELNKTYGGYIEQVQMHEFALARKNEEIESFKSGKWPRKLIVMLNKQMSREIIDVDEIVELLSREQKIIGQAMDNLRCQMEQKRDEYVECMMRTSSILQQKIGKSSIKELSAARNTGKQYGKQEQEAIKQEVESASVEDLEKEVAAKKGKK